MQSIFFKEAQQNFDQLCQKACQDHEPCIVNREDNNHVVILSLRTSTQFIPVSHVFRAA